MKFQCLSLGGTAAKSQAAMSIKFKYLLKSWVFCLKSTASYITYTVTYKIAGNGQVFFPGLKVKTYGRQGRSWVLLLPFISIVVSWSF